MELDPDKVGEFDIANIVVITINSSQDKIVTFYITLYEMLIQ